jgi:pimeloyl-ACP methyl ester carboxylesterase/DNA-binding CsgD family transcriptional regulator
VATWLTHLELDWGSPIWAHWLDRLGETHTVLRYDERGCGLSDPEVGEPSVETWVGDLEAVIRAAGLERFTLLGVSQGAAIAVAYAEKHPDRVSDLVLYGGYARGRRVRGQGEQEDGLVSAIRAGWTSEDPAFRRVFSMLFLPHGTPEQMAWYDELLRRTSTPDTAARLFRARGAVDVVELARRVRVRTLVMHARDDRVVPAEEGRLLAALIPDARLVVLESANHILLADEPAWEQFLAELGEFLGESGRSAAPASLGDLSARELEVLELVASGLTNEAIAARLVLSVRTVEHHLSNIYAKLGVSGKAARAAAAVSFIELRASRNERATRMGARPDVWARSRA